MSHLPSLIHYNIYCTKKSRFKGVSDYQKIQRKWNSLKPNSHL